MRSASWRRSRPAGEAGGAGDLTLLFGAASATVTAKGLNWKNGNGAVGVTIDGAVTLNGNLWGTTGEGFDSISVA